MPTSRGKSPPRPSTTSLPTASSPNELAINDAPARIHAPPARARMECTCNYFPFPRMAPRRPPNGRRIGVARGEPRSSSMPPPCPPRSGAGRPPPTRRWARLRSQTQSADTICIASQPPRTRNVVHSDSGRGGADCTGRCHPRLLVTGIADVAAHTRTSTARLARHCRATRVPGCSTLELAQ